MTASRFSASAFQPNVGTRAILLCLPIAVRFYRGLLRVFIPATPSNSPATIGSEGADFKPLSAPLGLPCCPGANKSLLALSVREAGKFSQVRGKEPPPSRRSRASAYRSERRTGIAARRPNGAYRPSPPPRRCNSPRQPDRRRSCQGGLAWSRSPPSRRQEVGRGRPALRRRSQARAWAAGLRAPPGGALSIA